MSLPVAKPVVDHIGETGETLTALFNGVLGTIANNLTVAVNQISNNDRHTAAEFWARQGTNGAAILAEFDYWRKVLESKAPNLVTETIAAAGSTLQINQDGSITVPN